MRKTLSLVLSVIMLLSVCSFAIPASAAPEGTAINTADEFMNMAAEGKYYLNSDITLGGTYPNAFNGTFDGNGHCVTISNPMFADFSGEVKNLTIKGAVYVTDMDGAAFACKSSNGVIVTDVINNASVTVMGTGKHAAGIVALDVATQTNKANTGSVYTNVVNNGEIYLESSAPEFPTAAGITAMVDSVTFTNCVNNAKITSKGCSAVSAGIGGRVSPVKANNCCEVYSCVNNGEITSIESYFAPDGVTPTKGYSEAGGIIANIGKKSNIGIYRIWGCVNNGNITATYRVGGIVGYVYGSKSDQYIDIQFCINAGNLTYGRTASSETNVFDWCGPFVGYTNTDATTIKYNIDIGSYTKDPNAITMNPGMSFFGCSSYDSMGCDIQHNYILNKANFAYYTYASSDDNAAQRHTIDEKDGIYSVTLEDISSGKIAYEINKAAAADEFLPAEGYFFYQNLGTDTLPTTDNTHGWVVLSNGAYANGTPGEDTTEPEQTQPKDTEPEQTQPEATEPEATEPEATQGGEEQTQAQQGGNTTEPAPEKKGCGGFVAGGAFIVAILGTALIIKKRD